jgi:GNAT superfamily N-acetyltransferase
MEIKPLTLNDLQPWAGLLSNAFERTPVEMEGLLCWMSKADRLIAYGAWDGEQLAAQYACLLTDLCLSEATVKVGMSLNMCVHPRYRGQGLIKQVSKPVYEAVQQRGGIAGVGFSNAEGVKVDQKSKGYGYQVVGELQSTVGWLKPRKTAPTITISNIFPDAAVLNAPSTGIHFDVSPSSLHHRYAQHPFRRYQFGIWQEGDIVSGLVIYRETELRGLRAVSLLGAYSQELTELLAGWSRAMRTQGIQIIHFLTTPQAQLLNAVKQIAICTKTPSRNPYFLTVKPFYEQPTLLDFSAWDCVGGDVL